MSDQREDCGGDCGSCVRCRSYQDECERQAYEQGLADHADREREAQEIWDAGEAARNEADAEGRP